MRSVIFILALHTINLVGLSQNFPTGEVVDSIFCKYHPKQSYALYLPRAYTTAHTYPVLFVFDPMARGKFAASVFQSAAENFGYIVAASNNSRNGSWDIAFNSAEAMFNDALTRFSVDTTRMYTTGFSGGSRVATAVAVLSQKVSGIIGCGAGFSSLSDYRPSLNNTFVYVGIVGNKDMNYQEHRSVEKELDALAISNLRIVFDGRHSWPLADQIKLAFHWLELQTSKKGQNVLTDWNAQQAYTAFKQRADSIASAGTLVLAQESYAQMIQDFKDYSFVEEVVQAHDNLLSQKQYKKQFKSFDRTNKFEKNYQEKIGVAFTQAVYTRFKASNDSGAKGPDWWRQEIDILKRLSKSKNLSRHLMAERLLNLIWANFATSCFNFTEQNDLESAIAFNKIWLYTVPQNDWGNWNIAKLYARVGDVHMALEYLTNVISTKEQFKRQILEKEPAFSSILDHPKMIELLSKPNML